MNATELSRSRRQLPSDDVALHPPGKHRNAVDRSRTIECN
jgi:hypothetical protein